MGEVSCLVILPEQLVSAVIDIACSICAIRDAQDVAVIVIGVGVSNIVVGGFVMYRRHLTAGGGSGGRSKGIIRLEDLGLLMGDYRGAYSVEQIVGVRSYAVALAVGFDPVVIIVGELGVVVSCSGDILVDIAHLVIVIVGIAHQVVVAAAGLGVAHQPIYTVIHISAGNAGGRGCNGGDFVKDGSASTHRTVPLCSCALTAFAVLMLLLYHISCFIAAFYDFFSGFEPSPVSPFHYPAAGLG